MKHPLRNTPPQNGDDSLGGKSWLPGSSDNLYNLQPFTASPMTLRCIHSGHPREHYAVSLPTQGILSMTCNTLDGLTPPVSATPSFYTLQLTAQASHWASQSPGHWHHLAQHTLPSLSSILRPAGCSFNSRRRAHASSVALSRAPRWAFHLEHIAHPQSHPGLCPLAGDFLEVRELVIDFIWISVT